MKRFITYLYLYNGKTKEKNTGFIKVEINGNNSTFYIQVKNLNRYSANAQIYLVFEGYVGVQIGKLHIKNGEARARFETTVENINESGYGIDMVCGVRIEDDKMCMASCWIDDVDAVVGNSLNIWKRREPECEPKDDFWSVNGSKMTDLHDTDSLQNREEIVQLSDQKKEQSVSAAEVDSKSDSVLENRNDFGEEDVENKYRVAGVPDGIERIDISQLRMLPTKNWYLVNNSFLMHGYANYKHLALKTDIEGNRYLGVPGVSEPGERMMAKIFGFTDFMPATSVAAEEVSSGVFGYWFCPLKL